MLHFYYKKKVMLVFSGSFLMKIILINTLSTMLRMKNQILKMGIALMGVLIFSCTNNDSEPPTPVSMTKKMQNDLKLDQFANKNLEVNWENLQRTVKDSTEINEIEVTEKVKSEMISELLQKEVKYELIAVKNKGKVNSYLIEAFTNLNYEAFPANIQNLNKFAGTLNVYELNGTKIGQLTVLEGKAENPLENNLLEPLKTAINLFYKPKSLTKKVPQCNSVISVYSVEEVWTHRYSYNVTPSGVITNFKDLGESLTSTKSTLLYSEILPCGSSGNQEPRSATIHRIRVEQYDKTIVDDSYSNPCAKLNIQRFDTKHKNALAELKKNFGLHYETGYYISASKGYVAGTPKDDNQLTGPTYTDTYGIIHVHPNDYVVPPEEGHTEPKKVRFIHMPSPADIDTFCTMVMNANKYKKPLDEVFVEMVSSTGTYQLRFDGDINNVKNFNFKILEDIYKEHMNLYSEDLESGIITFIKKYIGVDGIVLYKINENGSSERKTFSPTKGLETNPC